MEPVALLKGRTVLVLGLTKVARSADAPHTRVAVVTHGWHVPSVTHGWHLSRGDRAAIEAAGEKEKEKEKEEDRVRQRKRSCGG